MKKYRASIEIDNKLEKVEFETKENPVEYIWQRYGMDSFIESVEELGSEVDVVNS